MSGGEFAAIEARAQRAQHARTEAMYARRYGVGVAESHLRAADASALDIPALLAAVRERDNTIAKVHELMQSWDNGDYDDMNQFSPHHFVRHLRAALDPQETP